MIGYIKEIATHVTNYQSAPPKWKLVDLVKALTEEIDRLDPRDFIPAGRFDFVRVRARARALTKVPHFSGEQIPFVADFGREVCTVLEHYGGEGSYAEKRSFAFVNDRDLRAIIERDYRELSLILFPSQAWKSTVVMAGSILEAILLDQLMNDSAKKAAASSASSAPKSDIAKGNWKLHDLIEVSSEIGLIPTERAKTIDQILRDYRNFVHPHREIRAAHECSEAEALLAKGGLDGICNHFAS